MTGLIVIDEAGDLGSSGTKYFTIAAIIVFRSRDLKMASLTIPNDKIEHKWNNSTPARRMGVLNSLSNSKIRVAYCVVNKNAPYDNHPIYGNDLYESVIKQVISDSMKCLPCKDVNVMLDRCNFLSLDKFRDLVYDEALKNGVNPLKVHMISSSDNKCIQLADFVAGACRSKYEYGDNSFDVIKNKVSFARRR